MLKQELGLKLQQKLSPLQIQTIKLIELPIQELEQRVRQEIDENPVLDDNRNSDNAENADISLSQISDDGTIPNYKLNINNYGKDERPQYNTFSVKQSFTQNLLEQLGFKQLSKHKYTIAAFIIGSLDEDGYLRRDIDSLVDDLAFRANVNTTHEEVAEMLKVVQELEPVGVGARDLRECLLLQLKTQKPNEDTNTAIVILSKFFDEFSARHYQKIMNRLNIDKDQMQAAIDKIVKLNPAPGGQIDDSYNDQAQQIIPDFLLDIVDGELVLTMPKLSIPEIRVNKKYGEILENAAHTNNKSEKEAASFVKQKLDSARWFVEALRQRQNTLYTTMSAILDYQKDYFMEGDEALLKPMVLKDIAEKTNFDISTISRVVNSKYIETHFGIYPLKYFFSEGMENQDGEEVSTRELKSALQDLIDKEDKSKPLTDNDLVIEMTKRGYKLARRTIAKYREQLNIPKARLRKQLL